MRNTGKYRARCLVCPWISKGGTSPLFEGYEGLRHVKREHPDAEGFVAAIEKRTDRLQTSLFNIPKRSKKKASFIKRNHKNRPLKTHKLPDTHTDYQRPKDRGMNVRRRQIT